ERNSWQEDSSIQAISDEAIILGDRNAPLCLHLKIVLEPPRERLFQIFRFDFSKIPSAAEVHRQYRSLRIRHLLNGLQHCAIASQCDQKIDFHSVEGSATRQLRSPRKFCFWCRSHSRIRYESVRAPRCCQR